MSSSASPGTFLNIWLILFDIITINDKKPFRGMYMIIASTENSHESVHDSRFRIAGCLSFIDAALTLPMIIVSILPASQDILGFLPFIEIPLAVVSTALFFYVFTQLKRLLIERYDIHDMNTIITALIFIGIFGGAYLIIMAIITAMFPNVDFISLLDTILGIPILLLAGIVGVFFGVRLLRIHDESSSLLRSYAVICLISSACFISIIFIPIGLLLWIPNGVILGIVFLKAAETETQVEFV